MEHCFWNVFWFNHYIRFTENYKFLIIGKKESQWVDKISVDFLWVQKLKLAVWTSKP